jgi:uncharacterized RDD family membrane protein YckC
MKAWKVTSWSPIFGQIAFNCDGKTQGIALNVEPEQAQAILAILSAQLQVTPVADQSPSVVVSTELVPQVLEADVPAAPATSGDVRRYCGYCGSPQSRQNRFCAHCGALIDAPPAPAKPATPVEIPGGIWQRLGAAFADSCLASIVGVIAWYALTNTGYLEPLDSLLGERFEAQIVYGFVLLGYMVLAQSIFQTTIGKYVFGLELASSKDSKSSPGFGVILLRETIGKTCSAIVFGIGFLRAVWNPRKQTWHDQLADTVVRKRATDAGLRKQLTVLVAAAVIVSFGTGAYNAWCKIEQNEKETTAVRFKFAVHDCDTAYASLLEIPRRQDDQWAARQERARIVLTRSDEYETRLVEVNDMIHRILRKELYMDHNDFEGYVYLQKVYKLRQEQNQKLKDEVQVVLATSPGAPDFKEKLSVLDMMDSEIQNIDREVQSLRREQ